MLRASDLAVRYDATLEDLAQIPFSSGNYRISWNTQGRVKQDFEGHHPMILDPGIVVDAGCSYGTVTFDLCRMYPEHQICGCDTEEDRLPRVDDLPDELRERLTFKKGDLFHLDRLFAPTSVACIYAMNYLSYLVSEHGSQFDDLLTMNLLADRYHGILTPNGKVCISGSGDGVDRFAWAVLQKTKDGFETLHHSRSFNTSSGLATLCRAFDVPFHYTGT